MKIGKFGKESDLQYQDTVEGSLFSVTDRVIDLIYTKYLKAAISYDHDVRVETYPFPREGVRKAIYNSLGHNNYADSVPIQIRIEDEVMYISNNCVLPRDWTVDTLLKPHKLIPFNPSIANAFYRAGYIEAWGRGIQKIFESCKEIGSPVPKYKQFGDDMTVRFVAAKIKLDKISKNPKHQNEALDDALDEALESKILIEIKNNPNVKREDLIKTLGVSRASVQRSMKNLQKNGRIARVGGKRFGHWEIL